MFHFDGISRLQELDVDRKRVFVRVDFDCSANNAGELLDDTLIAYAAPSLRWLLRQGAKLVVGAHRGPAAGKVDERWSLEPCGTKLAELLAAEVYLPEESSGPLVHKLVSELKPGSLVLLENLAFCPGEIAGDTAFALELADRIDLYVADCLSAPSTFSSVSELPRQCRDRTLGLRLEGELVAANRMLRLPAEERVVVLGGSFASQTDLLNWALRPGHTVILGGDVANTVLLASGVQLQRTQVQADLLPAARAWLGRARTLGIKVLLPTDARVADSVLRDTPTQVEIGALKSTQRLLDVGPDTITRARAALSNARGILVSGHFGTDAAQHSGTEELLACVAESSAFSLINSVGGLGIVQHLPEAQRERLGFISSAGPALPSLLLGKRLPQVECLRSA